MNNPHRKFIIFVFSLLFLFANIFSSYARSHEPMNEESISFDLSKSNLDLFDGDFLVIGDSYAHLMVDNTEENFNYVVKPGYKVLDIYYNLLPMIKQGAGKYAFLFIGPNDYSRQVNPEEFKFVLSLIVDSLKEKGMQVIMTDYTEPHIKFLYSINLLNSAYKFYQYNDAILDIVASKGLLYVPMHDLMNYYGYKEDVDLIHPRSELFEPLLHRVIDKVNEDIYNNKVSHLSSYIY